MSYQKQNFENGEVLTAPQLNHIEDGIVDVESAANTTKAVVDNIIDPTLSLSGKAADAAAVGGIVLPRVVVQAESGSSIVLSDGEKDVSGVAVDGSFSAALPHDGEWTVTATLGSFAATETVQAEYCRTKTLTMTYYTLTVTVKAGSAVTAQCGDKTVTGTVPESGSIKLYLPIAGTWAVTATLGDKTTEDSVEVSEYGDYHLELAYVHIYGASWDGTSTTALSRTDAAAGFTDPIPAVSNGTGSSPFDNLQPWAGMVRVTDSEAGELVSIPKFWYKFTKSGNTLKLQIADGQVDGFYVSPAHADRGDGKGERDVVYVGRYHCDSGYQSTTGVAVQTRITRSTARTNIHNLGATIWQCDYAMLLTIQMLYLVEFADWNSQTKIGYGCSASGSKANNGQTDAMQYHTGTTAANRTTYGFTQYRYIEGLWDNVYDWMDGCYYNSSGMNIILDPSKFSDSENGTSIGTPPGGFISAFNVVESGGVQWLCPSGNSGSDSTYIPDNWSFSASEPCLRCGGYYEQELYRGLFCVGEDSTSYSGSIVGCRLQKLP